MPERAKKMKMLDLARIRGLKGAREFLGLSLRELSLLIPPDSDRRQKHVSKSLVCAWQNGARMSQGQLDTVGLLIANKVTALVGRDIGIKVTCNSRWRFSAWGWCADCHRVFKLKSFRVRRCERCAAKRRGAK
jgi:hypothetical protein